MRRSSAVVPLTLGVAFLLPVGVANAAPPQASPCDALPGPARLACQGAAGVTSGVGGAVSGAVGSVAETAVSGIAKSFAEAGGFFLGKLGQLLTSTTHVEVGAGWFLQRYALMFGLSAFLTLCLLVLAVLKAVLRGQGLEAIKSGTVYYLGAVLASAFAPAFVYLLLLLSDGLTTAVAMGSGADTSRFLQGTGKVLGGLALSGQGTGGAATVLITAVVAIFCAVILWVELLLRTAIIYVSLLFAAPTFSGLVDRGLWKHARRWVYFTVSVIFAKPVVAAVLSLAAAGAAGGSGADGFTSVFVALALLMVSIFCVGLLFRLVPNAGDEMAGALHARRELKAGTPNSPVPGPSSVLRQSVQTHLVRGGSRAGAARAVPAAAGAAAGPAIVLTAASSAARRAKQAATQGAGTAVRAASAVPPQGGGQRAEPSTRKGR